MESCLQPLEIASIAYFLICALFHSIRQGNEIGLAPFAFQKATLAAKSTKEGGFIWVYFSKVNEQTFFLRATHNELKGLSCCQDHLSRGQEPNGTDGIKAGPAESS
jgi:hypothetical protein